MDGFGYGFILLIIVFIRFDLIKYNTICVSLHLLTLYMQAGFLYYQSSQYGILYTAMNHNQRYNNIYMLFLDTFRCIYEHFCQLLPKIRDGMQNCTYHPLSINTSVRERWHPTIFIFKSVIHPLNIDCYLLLIYYTINNSPQASNISISLTTANYPFCIL